jgi:hypothetical protein
MNSDRAPARRTRPPRWRRSPASRPAAPRGGRTRCGAAQRPAAGRPPRWPADRFDAQVEAQQRQHQRVLRQAQVGQHAGKAEAVDQPEAEGHDPAPAVEQTATRCSAPPAPRKRRWPIPPGATAAPPAQRGQRQRDGVRHGEGGDDAQHVPEGPARTGATGCHAGGVRTAARPHRRQQQRQQEQDVVEADPDVPDTVAQVVHELRDQRLASASTKACWAPAGPGWRCACARRRQVEQAAVLRVQIGKQGVADSAVRGAGRAGQLQGQHAVGAVGVLVHLLRAHAQRAGLPSAARPGAHWHRRRCRHGAGALRPR